MSAPPPGELDVPGASGPTATRRLDIQGLRAVAVLMVVSFHAGLPVPGGFVGVDVFFVISGFVITAMLMREWTGTARIAFGNFYWRRFRRLMPALSLVVCFAVVASALVLSPLGTQQTAAITAIGAMLLSANVAIAVSSFGYFGADANNNPLLNTWSLSVEEQFYLVFPLVLVLGLIVARRFGGGRRWIPVALVSAVAGISLCLAMWAIAHPIAHVPLPVLGFYSPIPRAWEFAAGGLLAFCATRFGSISAWVANGAAILGAAMIVGSLWLITASTPFPGPWTLLPVAGTLLLIWSGTGARTWLSGLLASRGTVKVGDWSYSIYLWHWPMIVLAGVIWPDRPWVVICAATLSFAPALASYRFLESPIRVRTVLNPPHALRFALMTMIPPLALATAMWIAVAHGFWNGAIQSFQAGVLPDHISRVLGCSDLKSPADWSRDDCVWNAGESGRRIYLVGDSHAEHLSEAVIAAAARIGSPATAFTPGGCPLIDLEFKRGGVPPASDEACNTYMSERLDWFGHQSPGLVVLSMSDAYWLDPQVGIVASDGTIAYDQNQKLASFRDGLLSTVQQLRRSGHEVLIVEDVPQFRGSDAWSSASCSVLTITNDICGRSIEAEDVRRVRSGISSAEHAVAERAGAELLSLVPLLCPTGTCSTGNDGIQIYKDGNHLSVPGNSLLVDVFARALM